MGARGQALTHGSPQETGQGEEGQAEGEGVPAGVQGHHDQGKEEGIQQDTQGEK